MAKFEDENIRYMKNMRICGSFTRIKTKLNLNFIIPLSSFNINFIILNKNH